VMQCFAVCCSVLRCVAVCGNMLQNESLNINRFVAQLCKHGLTPSKGVDLWCVAVCGSKLQRKAI